MLGRKIEGRLLKSASDRLREIFPILRDNKFVRLIRYDWLVISYANGLCCKYTKSFHENYIRQKIRLAGRLLFAIKEKNPDVTDFASIYNPKFYRSVVAGIRKLAKFNEISNEVGYPSTAMECTALIKDMRLCLEVSYITQGKAVEQKITKDFLTLMKADIGISINRVATDTLFENRRNKKQNIPTTDDIKLLTQYIDTNRRKSFKILSAGFSTEEWKNLVRLTCGSIIVNNRKRVGEIKNILITDFNNIEKVDVENQTLDTLPGQEKETVKQISRIVVRGKLGRTVPILLKPDVMECIHLIRLHRKEAGVPLKNPYVFGWPSSVRILQVDACALLRDFSSQSGAHEPKKLRATNMRKHLATACISLELNDAAVSGVASFMGHDEKIHREFYRHNPVIREIALMTKVDMLIFLFFKSYC